MGRTLIRDYDLGRIDAVTLYTEIIKARGELTKAQILYVGGGKEYSAENISLDWLSVVDAHTFFVWIELKKAQKQRYNVQSYIIIFRLYLL